MLKLFFLFVLFFGFFCKKQYQKIYLVFMMILLFFTIVLRHETCYLDTYRYVEDFRSLSSLNFSAVGVFWDKDVSFWYLSKAISDITGGNYTLWFAILSFIYLCPLYLLLRKYSSDVQLSLVVFCCLGFAIFSMTGLRQMVAMGFTTAALYCLLNSKIKLSLIWVLLAVLCHKSALIFCIIYPISQLPFTRKYIIIYAIVGIVGYICFTRYLPSFFLSDFDSRFQTYELNANTLNYSGLVQQIAIFIVSCIFIRKGDVLNHNRVFLWMSILGIFFQSMTAILPEMFRVSMYFSIANICLLSNALSSRSGHKIIRFLILMLMTAYFVTSSNNGFLNDYYFFFQDVPMSVYQNLY